MNPKYAHHSTAVRSAIFKASNGQEIIGETEYVKEAPRTSNSPSEGEEILFMIGREGNRFIESLSLHLEISAPTKTGGTYLRLANNAAPWLFQYIEFRCSGREVIRLYPWDIYQRLLMSSESPNDWDVVKLQIGNGSNSERESLAGEKQELIVEFSRFVDFLMRPFPIFLLNNGEIEIRAKLVNDFSSIIQTDGTLTNKFSIQDCYCISEYITPTPEIVQGFRDQAQIIMPSLRPTYKKLNLASGSKSYNYNITELQNKDVLFWAFHLLTTTNDSTGKDYTNFEKLGSFELVSSGNELSNTRFPITDSLFRKIMISDYTPANQSTLIKDNLYFVSYSHDLKHEICPAAHNYGKMSVRLGSRMFTESDVQLRINFGSNLGSDMVAYMVIYENLPLVIRNGQIDNL